MSCRRMMGMVLKRRATQRIAFPSEDRRTFCRGRNLCDKRMCASEISLPRYLGRGGNVQRTRTAGRAYPETRDRRRVSQQMTGGFEVFNATVCLAFEVQASSSASK